VIALGTVILSMSGLLNSALGQMKAFSVTLTIGITVLFVGFLITRSAGLLAESGHSLADTGNQALLMLGSKRGKRPADRAQGRRFDRPP